MNDDNFEKNLKRIVEFIFTVSLVVVLIIISWFVVLGPLMFARRTNYLSVLVYVVYAVLLVVSIVRAEKRAGGKRENH